MRTALTLVLLLISSGPLLAAAPASLNKAPLIARTGVADRIEIQSSEVMLSADEVVQFEAVLYDALNNVVEGNISWSANNGTITSDGMFFPWSSGVVEIAASSNGLQDRYNITVTPGVPVELEITSLQFGVLEPTPLTASMIDGRGNRMGGSENMVWDVDGTFVGRGSPDWTPDDIGEYEMRVRLNQLETHVTVTVAAGQPDHFEFEPNIRVRAGDWSYITPRLVDANGFEMPLTTAGALTWYAENGTFNEFGAYFAARTGRWNVSVSAGNVTGSTRIQVIPGDAVASELMFLNEPSVFMAGDAYELVFERRDANGYIGFVSPEISSLSATTGGLSVDDEGRVYWNPSSTGPAVIAGYDGGVPSFLTVTVEHGRPIDVVFKVTPSSPSAGDTAVVELLAEDVKGNRWVVNGTLTMTMGEESEVTKRDLHTLVHATTAQSWRFDGSWFDNRTGTMFTSDTSFDVKPGRLAFITLDGDGSTVPADGEIDLNPTFFDAFGNSLDAMTLNWSHNGADITLEMLLNDGRWIASGVGEHVIRVNAAGVFATVRLTVVVGGAHALQTDADEGLTVKAGEPSDLFVQVVDIHGNIAESTNVTTTLNTSLGELTASPTGIGYWAFTGKLVGEYDLVLSEAGAEHTVPIIVEAGQPVRIQASMSRASIAEGDVVLMNAFGTDAFGNTLTIPRSNTSVTCTAGDVGFVTNGTWEVDVTTGGTDRSCTVRWNGLLAQTFFDVDEVLLGGAVGSTNTAMTMAALLLCLLLAVLVVLSRKANEGPQREWVDDVFDEDDADDEVEANQEQNAEAKDASETALERHGLDETAIKNLAKEAGKVGVMQATPSTTQGQTGWYVDVSEELQYWEVTPDGEWIRHD